MTVPDNLAPTYDPRAVEPEIARLWNDGNYFHADPQSPGEPYVIVIPPPNVTGALHGGHALNNTLQDILVRWHRMRGFNTLWMPGTDHAGIATQAVVEKRIFESEKKSRHDLGREELVKRIWDWKDHYEARILSQLKLMGCSCDWERTRFTLDDICARAVRHTFFKLFKDGLIVRGKRLVNWDTHLQTAVADDEVYHESVKGHFYHFKYPVIDPKPGEPAFVHIATTRPETMLGDTAVAVHPEPTDALDKLGDQLRHELEMAAVRDRPAIEKQLEELAERRDRVLPTLIKLRDMARDGRQVMLPLVDRPIPLICDEWAKPELGSGCVKITPAHDPNDYEVGQRHKLAQINVMTPDGRIADLSSHTQNAEATKSLEGLKFATEGRKAVVAAMEALGFVEKIEDRDIDVGHSDRSKTPIEPYLSDQWFVRMGDLEPEHAAKVEGLRGASGLAQLAMDAVCHESHGSAEERRACGKVHIFPERYAKTYLDWLGEKRDWCISRQLWWGHRIPVWSRDYDCQKPEDYEEMRNLWSNTQVTPLLVQGGQLAAFVFDESSGSRLYSPGDPIPEFLTWFDHPDTRPRCRVFACYIGDDAYVIDVLNLFCCMEQDPDVLDTWFSSALWPHSTLGWPENKPELQRYYPGSVLSTAREIITLWVARMVLTGMYNLGKVPFHDVYIHAVIQDGQGRPFKKTLGNGYDPVDIIEVYGADALRYTMATMTTETQDIRMPMKRVTLEDGRELQSSERFELGRNFCNKVWNAARFAFMTLAPEGAAGEGTSASSTAGTGAGRYDSALITHHSSLPIEDRWILSRVSAAAREVQDALGRFQFSRAANVARDFFWDSLCDWYLELVKSRIREDRHAAEARQVLAFALDQSLRLLHPFIPFITERLWQQLNAVCPQRELGGLPGNGEFPAGTAGTGAGRYDAKSPAGTAGSGAGRYDSALIVAAFPPVEGYPVLDAPDADAVFADLQTVTRAVRDIRQTQNVPPKQPVDVVIKVPAARVASMQREASVIRQLANVGTLTVDPGATAGRNAATLVIGDMQIFVLDVIDPAAELARLRKELENLDRQIGGIQNKLGNENFVSRAAAEVVQRERERLVELQEKRQTVVSTMESLG